jgi:hypothetical protein
MKDYRGELRVFGLLVFAALVTIVLYQGLSTASVGGDLLGARFTVGGPAALFVTLILIFSWRGLLTFSVEDKRAQTLARPIDKMTLQEAQRAIDDLQSDIEEIRRRREILQADRNAARETWGFGLRQNAPPLLTLLQSMRFSLSA